MQMEIISAAVMLFLIMDPLGNLPIFLSILKHIDKKRRRTVMIRELLIALFVMLLFLFLGEQILGFLNLKQEAVSIAGGIILFLRKASLKSITFRSVSESAPFKSTY